MDLKEAVLSVKGLKHRYGSHEILFPDFALNRGEELLISGPSGSGKTTLLNLLSGLSAIQSGEVSLLGKSLGDFSNHELDRFRGRHIGLVMQRPVLIRALTIFENLKYSRFFGRLKPDPEHCNHLLDELGLNHRKNHFPYQLSGGERQRAGIGIALAKNPEILIADEPTSSLDDPNAHIVYELLSSEAKRNNATLIIVSHDNRLIPHFKHIVKL